MKKGFTLIELLVVVAIISLLTSVVLASLNQARSRAREARLVSDIQEIIKAMNLYANDNGNNFPDMTDNSGRAVCLGGDSSTECWNSGSQLYGNDTLNTELRAYLQTIPVNPNSSLQKKNYLYFDEDVYTEGNCTQGNPQYGPAIGFVLETDNPVTSDCPANTMLACCGSATQCQAGTYCIYPIK